MKSLTKITKKNNKQKLGIHNKELIIRLAKKKNDSSMYHFVLTRKRSQAGSRFDKIGFFEIKKNPRNKIALVGLNSKKFKDSLALGASIHVSVYKLLFN